VVQAGQQQPRSLGVAVQAGQQLLGNEAAQLEGQRGAGLHRQVSKGVGQQQLRKGGLALRHALAVEQGGAAGLQGRGRGRGRQGLQPTSEVGQAGSTLLARAIICKVAAE
jgi:hypothetical protein